MLYRNKLFYLSFFILIQYIVSFYKAFRLFIFLISYRSNFFKTIYSIIIVIFVLIKFDSYSQENVFNKVDSLKNYTFDNLNDKFYDALNNKKEDAKIYALQYLNKAKNERNEIQIAWSHYLLATFYGLKSDKFLFHLDKAIEISRKENDRKLLTVLLINRAIIYEEKGKFNEAINDHIEGIEQSKKIGNNEYLYIIKHNIGLLKRKLGKYEEAKLLFSECLLYEENKTNKSKEDSLSYLTTFSELITTYRYNNQIDSLAILNKRGISMGRNYRILYLFHLNEGIKHYYTKNYQKSINIIESVIPKFYIEENQRFFENYNLIDAYLYLGKSYNSISKPEKSIFYYKKIDSIISATNYYTPQNRLIYTNLINYYKSINNKSNQLLYINRLLYVDSILDNDYKIINNKIIKEYDTQELLNEKEEIIASIKGTNYNYKNLIISLTVLIILISFLFYYQYQKRKLLKNRFNLLMKNKVNNLKTIINSTKKSNSFNSEEIGISEEIIFNILKKIDRFEQNQDFLKPNITTNSLAKEFETNPKYVSKIIHYKKDKNFTQYINDLRIEYVIEKLKTDNKFRKYSIKAISEEVGYGNTQTFSNYFNKKTGIQPSFFIKQLNIQSSEDQDFEL